MGEKTKNTSSRWRVLLVLLLWSLPPAIGFVLAEWIWWQFQFAPNSIQNALLISFVPGIITTVAQIFLLERVLKKSAVRAWLPVSLVGLTVSAIVFYLNMRNLMNNPSLNLTLLAVTVPVAVVQALWLHRRVKYAWLWIAGGIVSALLFTLTYQQTIITSASSVYLPMATGGLLMGIISNIVLRYLWMNERPKDKRKIATEALADDDSEHAERIERLHDAAPDEQNDVEAESLAKLLRS